MGTKIGFFLFAGLLAGAILGQLVYGAPAVGAVAFGALGVVLALLLDYSSGQDEDKND